MSYTHFIPALLFVLSSNFVTGQEQFCKTWFTEGKESKVRFYKGTDGKYYVKLAWMRDSLENGRPKMDTKNPDKSKRTRPWLGTIITNGMEAKSATELVKGKIYDPSHGNIYDCKMTLISDKIIELRGFILGWSFLGRTTRWHLAED